MAQSNLAVIAENGVFNVPTVKSAVTNATLPKAKPPVNDAVMYDAGGSLILTKQYDGKTIAEQIDAQVKVYRSIKKQAKANLERLMSIGKLLNELRSYFKSDVQYGQFLQKTELSTMSRQDRSDAQWLATNWTLVQDQMKKLDISSSSASYLRQLLRSNGQTKSEVNATVEPSTPNQPKVETAVQPKVDNVPVQPKVDNATVQPKVDNANVQPKVDAVTQPKVETTVEDSTLEIIVDNAEAFADSIANLAKAEGLDLNAVIEALLKRI
jgi:hypothetical protein